MPDAATLKRLIRKGTLDAGLRAGAVRLGVQEQGRAAAARRGGRLHAERRSTFRRSRACCPTATRKTTRPSSDDAPFSALAFKIMNDPFVGSLTFTRIYSGKLAKGTVLNSVKDKKEKIGRMLLMHSNNREDIDEAFAGDIVAIAGLKDTTTGDTLCDPAKPIILERMEFPDPVIELSVEPKTKADQEKMGVALNRLAAEDPSFRVSTDHESGQTIIKGMGELHLDILVDRMKREFKVEANVGAPQVAYRESLAREVEVDLHPQEAVGWFGPVRRSQGRRHPRRTRPGRHLRRRDQGRQHPARIYPVGREGHARAGRKRLPGRLPDHRLHHRADRRQVPRRRLEHGGVRDHRSRRDARSGPEGRASSCSSRS